MTQDIYDKLAKEAVTWFVGWLHPNIEKSDIEQIEIDIAKVFRNGLPEAKQ